jgi:hypothetical protein
MRPLKQRNDTGPTTSVCDNAVISTEGASFHCPLSVRAGGARWLVISGRKRRDRSWGSTAAAHARQTFRRQPSRFSLSGRAGIGVRRPPHGFHAAVPWARYEVPRWLCSWMPTRDANAQSRDCGTAICHLESRHDFFRTLLHGSHSAYACISRIMADPR